MKKNTFLVYSHQEYYCCLFRKVYFYICPVSFIKTSKIVLIICARIKTKILMFGEAEAPEKSFWDCNLHVSYARTFCEF